MGWRENAESLREHIKKTVYEGLAKEYPPEFFQALDKMPEPGPGYAWTLGVTDNTDLDPEFLRALDASSRRNMSPLADYLKSDRPLGRKERDRLARFLPKATGKHGHSTQLRAAANRAEFFYTELRNLNRMRGIRDHGECGLMKEYAVRATVEDWFVLEPVRGQMSIDAFAEQVLALLEKPKSRRAGAEKGIVSFPVFHPKYRPKP